MKKTQQSSKGGEAFDVVKEYDILFLGDQRGDHKLAHEDALRHLEKLIREDAARSETGPSEDTKRMQWLMEHCSGIDGPDGMDYVTFSIDWHFTMKMPKYDEDKADAQFLAALDQARLGEMGG